MNFKTRLTLYVLAFLPALLISEAVFAQDTAGIGNDSLRWNHDNDWNTTGIAYFKDTTDASSSETVNEGGGTVNFGSNLGSVGATNVIITFNIDNQQIIIHPITPNQLSLANYLAYLNQIFTLPQRIANMLATTINPQQYQATLDQTSGATYANEILSLSRIAYASGFESEIGDRLSLFPYSNNYFSSPKSRHCENYNNNRIFWATVEGGNEQLQKTNVSGLNSNDEGITVGMEFPIRENSNIGGAVGITHFIGNATAPEITNDHGNLFQAGVYGRYQTGRLLWGLDANFGETDNVDTSRTIAASEANVSGQYHANLLSEQLRVTYNAYQNIIRPFLGMYNQTIFIPNFTESGNTGYELTVNTNTYQSLRSLVGILFDIPTHSIVKPFFSGTYEHEFAQTSGSFDAQLAAIHGPAYFHIVGTSMGRDLADIKGGIMLTTSKRWNLSALYEGQFAQSWVANSGRLQLTVNV